MSRIRGVCFVISWLFLNCMLACCSGTEESSTSASPPPAAADVSAPTNAAPSTIPEQATQTQRAGAMASTEPAPAVKMPTAATASMVAGAAAAPAAGAAPSALPDAGAVQVPTLDSGTKHAGNTEIRCQATSQIKPGDTTGSIDAGGTRRTYTLHVPPNYTGTTAVPLLIDMHGLFGNAQGQLRGSGTAAVADREGFIVAYPDGIDNAWNVGPCCTFDRGVDDVGFMRALVDTVKMQACIDSSRVYATGVSMGGGMSHYLACEAAETFAAVAPAAFDLLEENTCMPARPIAVLSSRGTADNIVPYSGGASTPPNGVQTTIHFRGAEGTFKEWARINGCTGEPSASYDECQSYTQCTGEVEVTLCTKQGGGHTYGDPERAWKMLSKYRRP